MMKNNIKFGIKISTKNFDLIPEIYLNKDIIDFIEIILLPDFALEEIEIIKNLKMPYVIHFPSSNYGIDFGNRKRNCQNLDYIEKINSYQKQGQMNLKI